MKTISVSFLFAFLLIAAPAFAKKHDPCPGSNAGSGARLSRNHSDRTHSYRSSPGRSNRSIHKRNKGWERPKNLLHLKGRNPNRGGARNYSEGGFYSFKRHSYSAHIFRKH